jgi:hypothetical protein
MLEEFEAQHKITVAYTTLTRFCRDYGIGRVKKEPVCRIVTDPGEEAQHDTSPYVIEVGGRKVKRQCASLVLGYSRLMHIRFYEKFDRFHCKVFLTDSFKKHEGTCGRIVIDNTHVVIACGTGKRAQVSPEMESFEKRFGFKFLAHELGHANRSGKVERCFHYVETNFLAGRTFKDDGELNRQAQEWLDSKANVRVLRELGASPKELFAAEKAHLIPLPLYVPEVYQLHRRDVDGYGYVQLSGMRYSVPTESLGRTLMVREAEEEVVILDGGLEVARHKKLHGSEGSIQSTLPGHVHRSGHRPPAPPPEESRLKAMGSVMTAYLERLKHRRGHRYGWSVRKLHAILCQYHSDDVIRAVEIAAAHGVYDIRRIEGILLRNLARQDYLIPLEPQEYEDSPGFRKGASTPASDMSCYGMQEKTNGGADNAR